MWVIFARGLQGGADPNYINEGAWHATPLMIASVQGCVRACARACVVTVLAAAPRASIG
jgi:hypothetical protein